MGNESLMLRTNPLPGGVGGKLIAIVLPAELLAAAGVDFKRGFVLVPVTRRELTDEVVFELESRPKNSAKSVPTVDPWELLREWTSAFTACPFNAGTDWARGIFDVLRRTRETIKLHDEGKAPG
jgi:hypothetical protein